MIKFIAVVALFLAVASAGTLPRRLDGKIVGGEEISIEEVPHQISIQYRGRHNCGGSIISKNWVLTAAHCLHESNHFTVNAGSAHSQKPSSVHRISQIISHANFSLNDKVVNDIALIRVREPFVFDETRKPVSLYAQDEVVPEGSVATVSGWGGLGNGKYPDILNIVRLPIISKDRCAALYIHFVPIQKGQICTLYDEGGKDPCHGDSGGPLTVDGRLAGIVSWGGGCVFTAKPAVYTEVAYYRDWIKKHSGV